MAVTAPLAFAEALIAAGADAPFEREGLLFWRVPLWVVEAYAAARLGRGDPLKAVVVACIGEAGHAECLGHPRAVIWDMGRGWVRRLGELERIVRGLSSATVNREGR
ncbi:MAG: hypothetical protein KIS90_00715 [Phenylobacterium sp.]|nr:hypothetical protein [Phenylobacterium sp.]